MKDINNILIKEFKLKPFQVEHTVKLIDDGNTIPFIARYRKEMTGELSDEILRALYDRLVYLRNFNQRKDDIKRLINEQEKMTNDISLSLDNAKSLQELEDIYRPYKPKRRTRATVAKEKGLEPLATILFIQELKADSFDATVEKFINEEKGVFTIVDALAGAMDIIAENISDNAEYRKYIRDVFYYSGTLFSKAKKKEDSVYRMYYDFKEPVSKIAGHRVLALNRGEKEGFLNVKIDVASEKSTDYLKLKNLKNNGSIARQYVEKAIEDSYDRLIFSSIEREVRNSLTEVAEENAMKVFSVNLKNLLLSPPVKGKVVLGLDPAYRTGCKIAVVNETGRVLDTTVIYPTPPVNKIEESRKVIKGLITKHNVDIVSIGNGTASKESEIFVADLLKDVDKEVYYIVVSESGASVYSASKLGTEEFPNFDVALRSAISIARRLQDPLAELVKIDPKSIGVGQYQHDMNQKRLSESLQGVVESCVNSVGVDLNTASPSLLSYIAGINSSISKNIVEYRETNGEFKTRRELIKVKKLGEKAFLQCAGFLRITESKNILDNTSVHPESYDAAKKLLEVMDYTLKDINTSKIKNLESDVTNKGLSEIASQLDIGIPTLKDMMKELAKPGRDPRDELTKPMLQSDIMHMEDLKSGMVLTGTVRNVADFGAFVDIGVHQDGLVHISHLCNRYIKSPLEVVQVGDIVKVKVLDIEVDKKRISLSMKETNQ